MGEGVEARCPACGARVDRGSVCRSCGLQLGGVDEAELRDLGTRLQTLDAELAKLSAQRQQAAAELHRRRLALRTSAVPAHGESAEWKTRWSEPRRELSPDSIRNWLLWLGTALLALSGLTFTAVAWTRLDDGGRAALLGGATVVTIGLAIAVRRRLPATAEAIAALALALALIDWYALRRGGVAPGISGTTWWAVGTAFVGGLAAALGSVTAPRTTRYVTALLLPLSAALVVGTICGAPWSVALGFAMLAAALVWVAPPTGSRFGEERLAGLVRVEAFLIWIAAALAASIAATEADSFTATLAPTISVLALGLAPVALVVAGGGAARRHTLAAALAWACPTGAIVTLLSTAVGSVGLLTIAALVAAAEIALAGWVAEPWRRGGAIAGLTALVPGVVWASSGAVLAVFGPLGWFRAAWTGDTALTAGDVFAGPDVTFAFPVGMMAVVVFLAVAAAAFLAGTTHGRRTRIARTEPAIVLGTAAAAVALILAPVAGGASVGVASVVTTGTACGLLGASATWARKRTDLALGVCALALLPAIPALGWAAVTPAMTVAGISVLLVATLSAANFGRVEPLRTVHLAIAGASVIALAGFTCAAAGTGAAPAGFAAATTATALAVLGAMTTRTPNGVVLETIGAAGFAVGAAVAAEQLVWLAGALTVAVPMLTVVAFDRARRAPFGVVAAGAALGATWAWLGVADVSLVEAYTLPAAIAALVIGELALAHRPGRSLLTLGPAIVLALGPTLALAVDNDDPIRSIIAGSAAFVLVIVGARRRLQAPLFLGAIALLVLAIDTVGPAAIRLPRWVVLAIPGAILLWIGSNFERRREVMRQATQRFSRFT